MKVLYFLLLTLVSCVGEEYRQCAYACQTSGLQMHSVVSGPGGTVCTCGGPIQKEKKNE